MACSLVHFFLTLLVSLLLCCSPTLTAPARGVRETSGSGDARWQLVAGLEATSVYSLVRSPFESGLPEVSANTSVQSLLGHLCDLLAYYELAAKMDSSSDLQAILNVNARDACNWLKYLHSSKASVSCSPAPTADSSCSPEETTYLHQYCIRRKIFSFPIPSLVSSISLAARNFHSDLTGVDRCTWANVNLPEPHSTSIKNTIGC